MPNDYRIDHISTAVRDLDAFTKHMRERYGLGVKRFDFGYGLIPLGGHQYIEIQTRDMPIPGIVAWVEAMIVDGDRFSAWSVEPSSFDAFVAAHRLSDVAIFPDENDSGAIGISGRHAGTMTMVQTGGFLPYACTYNEPSAELDDVFEGLRTEVSHDRSVGGIIGLRVRGEEDRLLEWLGATVPGVTVDNDIASVIEVTVEIDGEPVVIEPA